MKAHIIQHVAFESAGYLATILQQRNYTIETSHLYAGDQLPDVNPELIVILGGPMSVHDEAQYPWLKEEKAWLKQRLQQGCRMIGICLGAQLLAEVLGGQVIAGKHREIGWFPVQTVAHHPSSPSSSFYAFHWHSETFTLPEGSHWLLRSEACEHQAFRWKQQVLALQCHLEVEEANIKALCQHCADELNDSLWVQSGEAMMATEHLTAAHQILAKMVDTLMEQGCA